MSLVKCLTKKKIEFFPLFLTLHFIKITVNFKVTSEGWYPGTLGGFSCVYFISTEFTPKNIYREQSPVRKEAKGWAAGGSSAGALGPVPLSVDTHLISVLSPHDPLSMIFPLTLLFEYFLQTRSNCFRAIAGTGTFHPCHLSGVQYMADFVLFCFVFARDDGFNSVGRFSLSLSFF